MGWPLPRNATRPEGALPLHKCPRGNGTYFGWDRKPGEGPLESNLRATLVRELGTFGDPAILSETHERFAAYLKDERTLDGNLRSPVFFLVGQNADAAVWEKLHLMARNADSFEQKRSLYTALAAARNPALALE